jgi:hypothetical protein
MSPIINVADLRDPDDSEGRSYRQVNAEKTHGIPEGALVELASGARLFVAHLGRDCDQTPLYWLAPETFDWEPTEPVYDSARRSWMMKWIGGYGEESLKVIHEE